MKRLKQEEHILSELTALYGSRGYRKYKPSCFEEYSLYLDNQDFLINKKVIAFSGTNGRMLALRPDVTLSIVNHIKPNRGDVQKLFYTEKVYRQLTGEFREISQAGVEVIGQIDGVCEAEIAMLIAETLAAVSFDYLIDISHMGFTEGLVSSFELDAADKILIYKLIKEKNFHDFSELAERNRLSETQIKAFERTIKVGGNAKEAVSALKPVCLNGQMETAVDELEKLIERLSLQGYGDRVNINLSIANNADYYNGIIFNGYINGIPHKVLSGGRYDKLLLKLGKNAGAIGFALYLGELEKYFKSDKNFVDVLVIYDESSMDKALNLSSVKIKEGRSVRLARVVPEDFNFGEIIDLMGDEGND